MKSFLSCSLLPVVMIVNLCIVIAAIILLSCSIAKSAERPVVNVPMEWRQSNYANGSCVHAAFVTLLRWQGRMNKANEWRQKYSGGEYIHGLDFADKLDREGVRYAYVTNGDVTFIEWACRTRRGCGVTVLGGQHMVTLVHFDDEWAAILDNNYTGAFIWIPRKEFIANWKASYGWAVTPIYTPTAPLPEPLLELCYPQQLHPKEKNHEATFRSLH